MPSRSIWLFSRRQYPHQVVLYIVTVPDMSRRSSIALPCTRTGTRGELRRAEAPGGNGSNVAESDEIPAGVVHRTPDSCDQYDRKPSLWTDPNAHPGEPGSMAG
ncbi:hypothetical protein MTP06_43730 [Streptomyces sp. PLM4]|nr:hypothetical protein MTP06_43730 [Streptomyces sp. PLM4]